MSIFLGSTKLKIIETTKTTATQFPAKTSCTICGKMCQISASVPKVKPIPTAKDKATIV